MNAPVRFRDWLREQRKAHGYSQAALADAIGVHRTYITQLENRTTWPEDETREKLHGVLGTTDDVLVSAGVATRKEYPRPNGQTRVVYEAAMREVREAAPAYDAGVAMPADLRELLSRVTWTPENVDAVRGVVSLIVRTDDRFGATPCEESHPPSTTSHPARAGTPREGN